MNGTHKPLPSLPTILTSCPQTPSLLSYSKALRVAFHAGVCLDAFYSAGSSLPTLSYWEVPDDPLWLSSILVASVVRRAVSPCVLVLPAPSLPYVLCRIDLLNPQNGPWGKHQPHHPHSTAGRQAQRWSVVLRGTAGSRLVAVWGQAVSGSQPRGQHRLRQTEAAACPWAARPPPDSHTSLRRHLVLCLPSTQGAFVLFMSLVHNSQTRKKKQNASKLERKK